LFIIHSAKSIKTNSHTSIVKVCDTTLKKALVIIASDVAERVQQSEFKSKNMDCSPTSVSGWT